MTTALDTPVRPPRRRRDFQGLDEAAVRELARPVLGSRAGTAQVTLPKQGINNQTFILRHPAAPDLVLKVRPRRGPGTRNSPQWPRYCQELFGKAPNGDVRTLESVTRVLTTHGSIRVPRLYLVDETLERIRAPYFIAEWLPGRPFDWEDRPVTGPAAPQLGAHLARLHAATAGDEGFGIYARRGEFRPEEWWPRFARAYRTIAGELSRGSSAIAAVRGDLDAALQQARATGPPPAFTLICVDQSPTHYLAAEDGTISGMVDLEAYLWAPREYELAMVELWMRDLPAFRAAYAEQLPWPEGMERVQPAYWFFTWMEWIYCLHTLLHDHERAAGLEEGLARLCRQVFPGGSITIQTSPGCTSGGS